MTTKITEQNISQLANAGVNWQPVVTADGSTGLTAVAGRGYFIDTTSGAQTVTLPTSPKVGDVVVLKDYARTWATNNVTIASTLFDGSTLSQTFSTNGQTVTLVRMDNTKGWSLVNEDTTTNLGAEFISATGGTVTTSGDFKIHTFTGDGCFVVATVGNPAGSDSVDYLVVAGGGGSGAGCSGGGGAGGFRMSNFYGLPAPTTSPLANPAGLPLSAQTYPITVGAGGAGGPTSPSPVVSKGVQGSSSIFSTITSAGGGYGASGHNIGASPGNDEGGNGGSGGGGMGANPINPGPSNPSLTGLGGSGNTPPVSPSQGNPGGAGVDGHSLYHASAGGGGAGAAGSNSPSYNSPNRSAGSGGVGSFVSPSFAVGCAGTPGPVPGVRYFAGGGGGGSDSAPAVVAPGGAGGGGDGKTVASSPSIGTAGAANTGGGAGGSHGGPSVSTGAVGGKGIVLIRYKFQ